MATGAFMSCCGARAGCINMKKTRRIYSELGLQLRNKTPKRRVKAKLRDDRQPATRPNEIWAMDFVHDQLATGQEAARADRRRHLLALLAGARSALQLPRRGCRGDAGTGRADKSAIRRRSASTRAASSSRATWICGPISAASRSTSRGPASRPTMPSSKRSTARFRAECLNAHWFLTLADAREKLEDWRRYYNEERPHGAIGNKSPITLQNSGGAPARHREQSRKTPASGDPRIGLRAPNPRTPRKSG